jgi:hypothetical protein
LPVMKSMSGCPTPSTDDGWAVCDGTTPASQGVVSPTITAATPNLNAGAFIRGAASSWTTGAASGGADTITIGSANLPTHAHTINHGHSNSFGLSGSTQFSTPGHVHGAGSLQFKTMESNGSGNWFVYNSNGTTFAIQYGATAGSASAIKVWTGQYNNTTAYTAGGAGSTGDGSSSSTGTVGFGGAVTDYSGSSGNGGFANTAMSILPTYFSAVYYMRVR